YPSIGWQPQQPTSVKSFLPFESSGACERVSCCEWHLSHLDCMNAPLYFLPITVTSSVRGAFLWWSCSPCRKPRGRTALVAAPALRSVTHPALPPLHVQSWAPRASSSFSSPFKASRAGLRETPFHSAFSSVSTAPAPSLSTVLVFASERACGPQ